MDTATTDIGGGEPKRRIREPMYLPDNTVEKT
jgi:hypothetical protein